MDRKLRHQLLNKMVHHAGVLFPRVIYHTQVPTVGELQYTLHLSSLSLNLT